MPIINTLEQSAESVAHQAVDDEDKLERERNQGGIEDQQAALIKAQLQQILSTKTAVQSSDASAQLPEVKCDVFLSAGEPATAQARADGGAGVEERQTNEEDDNESGLSDVQLEQIETTEITNQQVQGGANCSICMTVFVERETVSKLLCQHLCHTHCIVEWLQQHATCPVCHKNLFE